MHLRTFANGHACVSPTPSAAVALQLGPRPSSVDAVSHGDTATTEAAAWARSHGVATLEGDAAASSQARSRMARAIRGISSLLLAPRMRARSASAAQRVVRDGQHSSPCFSCTTARQPLPWGFTLPSLCNGFGAMAIVRCCSARAR